MLHSRKIKISTAGHRKETRWLQQELPWAELVERFRTPIRSAETLNEYLSFTKSKQDDLKDVGGFVGGSLLEGRRKANNVITRDLITLDLDNIPPGATEDVIRRVYGLGCRFAIYSTRKHSAHTPRLRVVFPIDRSVSADEYEPIARKLAGMIGMHFADPTTFEASRLMYFPSCSSDSLYEFHVNDAGFVSADGVLGLYTDWRNVQEWEFTQGVASSHKKLMAKQGDPLEKRGVIGAFCRLYDIHDAIEKFIPGMYTPTEDGRYTYIDGSTAGGAVVYQEGLFLYSHHATDPCSGKLVNAFDLVRLHLYGDDDDEVKADTPINKYPSFMNMSKFAMQEAGVADIMNQERYASVVSDFGTPPAVNYEVKDAASSEVKAAEQESSTAIETVEKDNGAGWVSSLKLNWTTGKPDKTSENILITLENDPLLRGRIRKDDFANSLMGFAPLPWYPRNDEEGAFEWSENDDHGLAIYIEMILGFHSKDKIKPALSQCAEHNSFNPVTSYLESLVWDGIPRLDNLFIDYLGAENTEYNKAVARISFTAAVYRAMRPGFKYDEMPVLTGGQGIGKTTLIQKMGKRWFSNSIETFEGKEAAELLQGNWIVEIGELSAFNRSGLETIKGFLSRTADHFRAAYAAKAEKHPRKCVFFGTSNRTDYLRDATGSRRFYPVDVGAFKPTKNVFTELDSEVDMLWAEAHFNYKMGMSVIMSNELLKAAKDQQDSHSEQDPREGIILDFMAKKVPVGWANKDIYERKLFWSSDFGTTDDILEERQSICASEVWVECLGGDVRTFKRFESAAIMDIMAKSEDFERKPTTHRYGVYGPAKSGFIRKVED